MNVTRKLMAEHELILKYIAFLDRFTLAWAKSKDDDNKRFESLAEIVQFIKNYADKYHHAKEEDILFRYLDDPQVLTHCNPLPVMLSDHDIGRSYVAKILQAIDTKNRDQAIANARAWGEHLSSHINKEDNVLYIMAEEGLSDQAKLAIIEEYALAEQKLEGSELEETYVTLLEQLESKNR